MIIKNNKKYIHGNILALRPRKHADFFSFLFPIKFFSVSWTWLPFLPLIFWRLHPVLQKSKSFLFLGFFFVWDSVPLSIGLVIYLKLNGNSKTHLIPRRHSPGSWLHRLIGPATTALAQKLWWRSCFSSPGLAFVSHHSAWSPSALSEGRWLTCDMHLFLLCMGGPPHPRIFSLRTCVCMPTPSSSHLACCFSRECSKLHKVLVLKQVPIPAFLFCYAGTSVQSLPRTHTTLTMHTCM